MRKRGRPRKEQMAVSEGSNAPLPNNEEAVATPAASTSPTTELTVLMIEGLVVGLTPSEVARKYNAPLELVEQLVETADIERKYQLSVMQWNAAKHGSEAMLKLLGKINLGQDDTQRIEIGGVPPGGEMTRQELIAQMKQLIEDNSDV